MDQTEIDTTRPEVVSAALIHLMSHYVRTGCPRLAMCVLRHMELLALHGKADPVLRDTCASLREIWEQIVVDVLTRSAHVVRH